jgi:YfiH family protein
VSTAVLKMTKTPIASAFCGVLSWKPDDLLLDLLLRLLLLRELLLRVLLLLLVFRAIAQMFLRCADYSMLGDGRQPLCYDSRRSMGQNFPEAMGITMIQCHQNGLPYLQFDTLRAFAGVRHAVFTRQGGISPEPFASLNLSVSVPDDKERVYANRSRAYGLAGRDTATVVHAHLVHGNAVARVTHQDYGTWINEVDGIITDEPGCALTMNFADCTPVLVYDPINGAIGLGHAGWQGTVRDLPGALVQAMTSAFGSDPAQLVAAIGPCIGPCCYEVGEPVISQVHQAFADGTSLLVDAPEGRSKAEGGRPYFDLPEANRRNLARAGVQHIELSGLCTACRTDLFFSHRAEKGRTGRFGTILIFEPNQTDSSQRII